MAPSRLVFTLIVALALPAMAAAAVPSPSNSTLDPCLLVCPSGDMTYHVLVRDFAANPVAGSSVVIDLCPATTVHLCPPTPNDGYVIAGGCQVVKTTDAQGVASFQIRAGGVWSGAPVNVYADGVLMRSLSAVSSPDQDGNLIVNAVDQGILAGKMGGADPTGDLNCSNDNDTNDAELFLRHLGHACVNVVPNISRTWGVIKLIYR